MRSRTAKWFICIVKYEKMQENGSLKKVTEYYVVDALSFSEAEARITEEIAKYANGEFEIANINPAPFGEIFFSEEETADKWYKTKLQFITIDEKTDKEKKSAVNYLVQAASLEGARKNIDEVMGKTMIDYVISDLNETTIMDVFEHKEK
jgi:hypothetical protein